MASKASKLMGIIEKADNAKRFLTSRRVSFMLCSVLAFFCFLNIMNVYADDSTPTVDITKGFGEQTTPLLNAATGTTNGNTVKLAGDQIPSAMAAVLTFGAPSITIAKDKLVALPISDSAKLGFLGVLEQNVNQAVNYPPKVDLMQHMAQEWIPGKDQSNYAAFASGYDFLTQLNIADLWNQMRNIAYVIFVLVLIVAGFLIMFRQKIGGQLAITVYNTIPNVILGLVLVTFSFAIVGIIIDLAVLAMNVIMGLFGLAKENYIYLGDPFRLIVDSATKTSKISALGPGSLTEAIRSTVEATAGGGIGGFVAGVGAAIPGFVFSLVVALVVLLLMVFAAVKVFITVFKAFLGIVFDTILAPIVITLSVIPGNDKMRKNWLNRIIKNAAVFPVVFFLINLPQFLQMKNILLDPSGFGNATLVNNGTSGSPMANLVAGLLPVFLYFMAAEAPKFLNDLLPADAARGSAEAVASLKKMPIIGGFM